jgi:phage terminase large subunit
MAVSNIGSVYVYKELYKPNLSLSQMVEEVLNLEENDEISYTVASPDLWSRRQEQAVSGIAIMNESGLHGLIKARNARIAGWRVMREYLARGRVTIFENCVNLIRTLPQLQYDSINIEDVSDSPHELTHAPEALRYGLMSLPYFLPKEKTADVFLTPTEREDKLSKSFSIRRTKK